MKMLPIGYDNFQEIISQDLNFVDKTLFIKEVLEDKATKVAVITRPRRFGKTLNLSMLHHFLTSQVDGKETKELFHHLHIEAYPDCMKHQGQYPVVFLSFKDLKELSYYQAQENIAKLLSDLYLNYDEVLLSPKLKSQHKETFQRIVKKNATEMELKSALKDLIHYLYLHYEIKPWLLIDEYDTPIHESYVRGYYAEMVNFMRGLLSTVLKSNSYLERAVITGILRVAKESLFSGLNNLKVYSILSSRYSDCFGFTEIEVETLLQQSHLTDQAAAIQDWYNGYQFGNSTVYNPWSIAYCLQEEGLIKPYWVNTSDNQLIKDLIKAAPLDFKIQFETLLRGEILEKLIDENMVFGDLNKNSSALWSLLLMSGYLKPVSSHPTEQGVLAKLAIPNREVRSLYRQIIEQWLSNGAGVERYNAFIASLLEGNIEEFTKHLQEVLLQITSVHDMAKEPEAFFHGLLLGFVASLQQTHLIQSNRESGLGRFDILLIPRDSMSHQPGIILELKLQQDKETLQQTAQRALHQIEEKHYAAPLKQHGIDKVISIGIGFQ